MLTRDRQLKDRTGSSRQAIRKYVAANNNLGSTSDKALSTHINSAISAGVTSGDFVQPKGPSGTVKLAKKVPAAATAAAPKPAATKTPKATTTKKPAAAKVREIQTRLVSNVMLISASESTRYQEGHRPKGSACQEGRCGQAKGKLC